MLAEALLHAQLDAVEHELRAPCRSVVGPT
jgi:hypothetical protein